MALINCPECKQEISDKAISCPNCGFPLSQMSESKLASLYFNEDLECPEFPDDLSIGKSIWGSANVYLGTFYNHDNFLIKGLPDGTTLSINIYTKGISIARRVSTLLFYPIINLHKSQLIKFSSTCEADIIRKK